MPGKRMVLPATAALILALASAAGAAGTAAAGTAAAGTAAAGTAAAGTAAVAGAVRPAGATTLLPHSTALTVSARPLQVPEAGLGAPSNASCRKEFGRPCYSPQEMRRVYGVNQLLNRGDDGSGETIVIIDALGSPTLAADLASFDTGYHLPPPPSLRVLAPLGTAVFDPENADMVGWAFETTLDVEWSHAMAPAARIVVLTSPVDETQGVHGMPQLDELENYALRRHLGQVISQSWGTAENTLFTRAGRRVLRNFERTYSRARAQRVTVLASAGDTGSANVKVNGRTFYRFPTVSFPASSPLVTAVGGTSLRASNRGRYRSERVWDNAHGAGGGGISQVFAEPAYQKALPRSDQRLLGGNRGLPDVSWDADPLTSNLVYVSFFPKASEDGYYFGGGTSEGAPQWAGLVADLDQLIGHPLGFLNPVLYALGAAGQGFHDITVGDNAFAGVPGYSATRGWDAASGWGTPDVTELLAHLAALAHGGPPRRGMPGRRW
jgi:subtilase family serine protease